MASTSTTQGDNHFSFAKIAAMPAPHNPQSSSVSNASDNAQPESLQNYPSSLDPGAQLPGSHHMNPIQPEHTQGDQLIDDLGRAVRDIDISPQKDREGSTSSFDGQENGLLKRENFFDDDRTHLSTSSTKMTNFDSKSLASVTTFAMDEKDSVRPDDSASVQAIDEEESLSGPASGAPNSVTGSEAGGRAFRDQFRDSSLQRPRGVFPISGPIFNTGSQRGSVAVTPDSVSNNFVVPADPAGLQGDQALHGFPLEPDEKLLEAMKSPKDRLLILQLEEKIRCFIKDESEQSLELPPSNAFGRLLAHKLGDYYHLTHFVDNNSTEKIIQEYELTTRRPTPLSDVHAANNSTPPPTVPAMKIMRRTDGEKPSAEGSTAASSSVPSKAPSEAGDGQDSGSSGGTPAKDRLTLTREEREAKYNQARERIFRDFPDTAKSDSANGDSNANMSRSSSTTGRKKNNRQRTPHDDGFEARSQFNAYYPGMPYTNGSTQYASGNGTMADGAYNSQVPYLVGPGVSPPTNGFVQSSGTSAMYPGNMNMNNTPQYPMAMSPQMASNGPWQGGNMSQQSPYPGYASMNQAGVMNQSSPPKSSPAMTNFAIPQTSPYQQTPNWSPQAYPPQNYQQTPAQRNQHPVHWPNYPTQSMTPNMATYSYAQYPGQHLNPGLQNPNGSTMPGNLPRSHFNPQTRSFVPGAPAPRHPMKGVQHTMPSYGPMAPPVQGQWSGYGDPTQNRNPDHSNLPNISNQNSRDSIAKWGTPAHLPPKPPPSEVPSEFDLKHRTGPAAVPTSPYNNGLAGTKNGPLVVSGGNAAPKAN